MGDTKQMKKLCMLFVLALLLCGAALADQNGFCDPIPEDFQAFDAADIQDCIAFDVPDGARHVYLITQYGSLCGYRLIEGEWRCVISGAALEGQGDALYFRRHQAGQTRPDGSAYADSLGFDLCSPTGAYAGYHFSGEYFTLCALCDPARYNGTVMVQDTQIAYYPAGSQTPEYQVDIQDETRLYGWLNDFERYPATPQEAQRLAALLPDALRDDFAGYTLAAYHNSRDWASADFAQVNHTRGNNLWVIHAEYTADQGQVSTGRLQEIPLSDRLSQMPAETLWQEFYTLFREPDALDTARLPVQGTIVDLHPQQEQLVLVTEDAQGDRRVVVATEEANGNYSLQTTAVLTPSSGIDNFHAGEGEIQLELISQSMGLGYIKTSSGVWKIDWVMGDHVDYQVAFGGVNYQYSENGDYAEGRLIGALAGNTDLFSADFNQIPRTMAQLRSAVDSAGWAVVNNPNLKDRLNLRTKASKQADSYGKFYNGTPVRVLKVSGDWCQVQIGSNGPTGWMVKQYLAAGSAANSVEQADPGVTWLEKYDLEGAELMGWTDRRRTTPAVIPRDIRIIGIADDLYIVMDKSSGEILYASMDDFWEGNG